MLSYAGRNYWILIDWDRGHIFFLNNKGISGNQEGMITWCWLSLFAVCGDDLLIQFNWVKQFNLINCIPPHMRDYNLPAFFSRRTFISTTRKNTPLRAWSGQTRHAKTVAFTSKSHNTFNSQRDNRPVLCGWSVGLFLKLSSTSRSWKKNLPVALRGIDSTKKIGTNSQCFSFVENKTKSLTADLFLSCHFCLA